MFDTRQDRMMALGFGFALINYPYPDGDIEGVDRAYIWGSFYSSYPPNPSYEGSHVGKARSRLIEQFKSRPNINHLVRLHAERVQGMESAAAPLLTQRAIDTAAGNALDIIGEIVGQERGGRNDAEYKTAIRVRVVLNTSSGEPETMITALRFFTSATYSRYIETYPAGVLLWSNGIIVPDGLGTILNSLAPAGVSVVATHVAGTPFALGDVAGTPEPGVGGFSQLESPTDGGQLSGII